MNTQISRLALVALAPARRADRRDDVLADVGGRRPGREAGQRDPARRAVPDQARADLRLRRQDRARDEPARRSAAARRSTSAATRRTASRRRRSATRRRAARAPALEREENAYLTASNTNLGTIFDKLGDKLKGATITGNNLLLNLQARPAADRRVGARGQVRRGRRAQPEDGGGLRDGLVADATTRTRSSRRTATRRSSTRRAPARLDVGAAEPRDAGPLPAGLDVQDRDRRGGARRRRSTRPTRRSTTPATAPSTASRSTTPATPTRRAGAVRQRQPRRRRTSTRSTPSSATSASSSAPAKMLDKAKNFGFYSKPPLETAVRTSVALERPLRLEDAQALRPDDPTQVDPGRLAFGQERLLVDAAADGARRGRRSRTAARS